MFHSSHARRPAGFTIAQIIRNKTHKKIWRRLRYFFIVQHGLIVYSFPRIVFLIFSRTLLLARGGERFPEIGVLSVGLINAGNKVIGIVAKIKLKSLLRLRLNES